VANVLTEVTPKLLAAGLLALREAAFLPRLVNRAYEAQAGLRGSTIDVPIPSAVAGGDVSPSAAPVQGADSGPTSVPIRLDRWKYANFYMTDKERLEIMDGVLPMQASEAIKYLANLINNDIFALYKDVYGYHGTAGTTPFGTNVETESSTGIRKVLNKQLAPMDPRHCVLDPDAEQNALNLRAFQDQSWRGDGSGIIEGQIGRKFGLNWYMHQLAPTHVAGTITTGLIAKASTAQAVGDKTIVCTTAASTGAANLKVGDIVTFAGQTQTYVLTEVAVQAVAATDVTLSIEPGLRVALAGSEAVAVKATHVVNLAFHRDAFAFASRPFAPVEAGLGSIVQSAVDPESGLTLRLEVTRQNKQTLWTYDILYGCATVRAALAARLVG